jgi:hypothetical protein
MMKIDSSVVDNNPTARVVAIVTYNFRGNKIDSTIIFARNFRDANDNYPGTYVNEYNFVGEPLPIPDLIVQGSLDSNATISGLNYGYGGNSGVNGFDRYNVKQCKVDFQVYWFGEVDVWFDKMIVDDKWANKLFDGTYDVKIREETTYESFIELINFLKKSNTIQPSNYLPVNYVLNKMESYLTEKNIAQAR